MGEIRNMGICTHGNQEMSLTSATLTHPGSPECTGLNEPHRAKPQGVHPMSTAQGRLTPVASAISCATKPTRMPTEVQSLCCREDPAAWEPCAPFAELQAENGKLREGLEAIAGFGDVDLTGQWDFALRDIIRSMTDCAK